MNPHELTDEEIERINDCWDAAEDIVIEE